MSREADGWVEIEGIRARRLAFNTATSIILDGQRVAIVPDSEGGAWPRCLLCAWEEAPCDREAACDAAWRHVWALHLTDIEEQQRKIWGPPPPSPPPGRHAPGDWPPLKLQIEPRKRAGRA